SARRLRDRARRRSGIAQRHARRAGSSRCGRSVSGCAATSENLLARRSGLCRGPRFGGGFLHFTRGLAPPQPCPLDRRGCSRRSTVAALARFPAPYRTLLAPGLRSRGVSGAVPPVSVRRTRARLSRLLLRIAAQSLPGRTDRARYPGRHGLARMDRPWALGGPRTLRLSALPVWGACG